MKSLLWTVTAVGVLTAAPARAQTAPALNGSLGYTVVEDGYNDVSLGAITARLGADFTPYLGLEGEAGIGVKDDSFNAGTLGRYDFELKSHAGVYAVGKLPLSPQAELFGRVGAARLNVETTVGAVSREDDLSGLSYGVGGAWYFDGKNGVRADYTRVDADDGDADMVSVAYVRRFR